MLWYHVWPERECAGIVWSLFACIACVKDTTQLREQQCNLDWSPMTSTHVLPNSQLVSKLKAMPFRLKGKQGSVSLWQNEVYLCERMCQFMMKIKGQNNRGMTLCPARKIPRMNVGSNGSDQLTDRGDIDCSKNNCCGLLSKPFAIPCRYLTIQLENQGSVCVQGDLSTPLSHL